MTHHSSTGSMKQTPPHQTNNLSGPNSCTPHQTISSTHSESHSRWLWIALWAAGLLASVLVHEWTSLDFWVQNFFYSNQTGDWLIASRDQLPRMVFYLLPKWSMIAITIALGCWLATDLFTKRLDTRECRGRFLLFICLIATPLVVGLIKRYSGVWCPSELTQYGGDHTFRLLFQSQPHGVKTGHGFPGGHASAGFAFMAAYYLPAAKNKRLIYGLTGCLAGWIMGLYQMFKGAHFLSHTTTTMCIAGLIATLLAQLILKNDDMAIVSD